MTLEGLLLDWRMKQCRKHDLAPDAVDYARADVDKLSNSEFLAELSSALEEWYAEKKA
jgi:hypothetical protein